MAADASKGVAITATIDAYQVQTPTNLFTNNQNSTSSCSSSDLKYLHKKFKRIATTNVDIEAPAPPSKVQPEITSIATDRSLRFNGYSVKNATTESTAKPSPLTNGDLAIVLGSKLLFQQQQQSYDRLSAIAANNHRQRDGKVVTPPPVASIPLFAQHNSDINATCDFSSKKISANPSATSGKVAASSSPSSMEDGSSGQPVTNTPGRYVCPFCSLNCTKPSVLRKHIRAHTNERPYPCAPCGIAFKTKSNLNKHYR